MVLNCNPATGNYLTSPKVFIKLYSDYDSIYRLYEKARRDKNNQPTVEKIHHLEIEGVRMDGSLAAKYYDYLWYLFFKANPEIINEVCKYNSFTDGYGDVEDNIANSTARVFRIVKIGGIKALRSSCKEFSKDLNNLIRMKNTNTVNHEKIEKYSFNDLERTAKKIVRDFGTASKEEVLREVEQESNIYYREILYPLVDIYYDIMKKSVTDQYALHRINAIWGKWNKLAHPELAIPSNVISID